MSDHVLPDDVRHWPTNPTELLGVTEDADRKVLRRAYSKLVRRYKPEHAPEEFQAIRAAYDSLLQFCKWREQFGDGEVGPATSESEIVQAEDDEQTPSDQTPVEWSDAAFVSTSQLIDQHWETAKAGQFGAAYREYKNLLQTRPGNEEIILRLYWLLKLAPQIDTKWNPVHWLFEAMQHGCVTPRLLTLYSEELDENPQLVTTPRAVKLLGVTAPNELLYRLAVVHMQATAKLRLWAAMKECLDTLRPRFAVDDSETWVRLIATALDEVAFAVEPDAVQLDEDLRAELDRNEHLQLPLGDAFDRAELLRILTEESRHENVSLRLIQLLAASWNGGTDDFQLQLLTFLEPWITDPDLGLSELDALAASGPVVLGRLMELLEYTASGGPEFDQSEGAINQLKSRLRKLLAKKRWPDYELLRVPLRSFCMKEGIPLSVVEYLLADDPEFFLLSNEDARMLHELSEDSALACLLHAHQAFWHSEE